jgi:hypothetical protein
MNNLVARTLASLLLGVLTLGSAAQAQSTPRVIKANIPFEFGVGNQVFPAGSYSLVSTAPALLELRDAEGHILAKVLTNSVEASKTTVTPTLQFNTEGGRYSLAQVWQENYSIGQQLQPLKSRVKTAKRNSSRTQTVAASNSQ